jgi:hypothetical protein
MHTVDASSRPLASTLLLVADPAVKKALMDAPPRIVTEVPLAVLDGRGLSDFLRPDAADCDASILIMSVKTRPKTMDRIRNDTAVMINASRALRDHARAACEHSRARVALTRRRLALNR